MLPFVGRSYATARWCYPHPLRQGMKGRKVNPMKTGSIYRIYNTVNGKSYVGQTIQNVDDYVNRKIKHCSSHVRNLYRAISKYNEESFDWEVLIVCKSEHLDFFERFYIQYYDCVDNGYNLEYGGNPNKVVSIETRKIMSKKKKGKPSPRKGVKLSDETRKKLSVSHTGKVFSETHRQNISKAMKLIQQGRNNTMSNKNKDKRRGQHTLFD